MTEQLHIIIVPHTHWDREWYQTFQQFRMRLVRTVDKLLDILDSDVAFTHFMLDGQTIILDDYLEVEPQQQEHLKRYAHEGRVQVGPWYVQPDEFLVSGEALIRNLQTGLSRAREFGNPMYVGYVPDTFGHIAQLPQILRGFNIDSAVFWRGVGEDACQSEFYWQAPDGSRVLVIHLADPIGYSNARQMPLSPEEFVTRVELQAANILAKATTDTLLFMNGSDHLEPQNGLPQIIAAANKRMEHISPERQNMLAHIGQLPHVKSDAQSATDAGYDAIDVRIGTLPQYIEYVRHYHEQHQGQLAPLQTLNGELRSSQYAPLLPAVLSARIWLKQQNTATEHLLERWVEPLTAWATQLGNSYPQGLIRVAWKLLLQNHPHDSICGCSIDQVHRENAIRFAQAQQVGEGILAQAMQQIVAATDTRAPFPAPLAGYEPVPIVVFNPAPAVRAAEVQTVVQLPGSLHNAALIDERGTHLPYRVVNRWRQEIGSMPIARDILLAAVAFSNVTSPVQLLQLAHSTIQTAMGQSDDTHIISRVYIEDYTESPLHHEHHIPQFGTVYVEVMLAPKGRIVVNEQELFTAGAQLLQLLQREDIHTFEVTLVDQARETIDFLATDLPAYGLKTFWLYPRGVKDAPIEAPGTLVQTLKAEPHALENEFYRIEVDTQSGTLTVQDKETGAVFTGMNRFIDGGDVGDLYNYCPPQHDLLISEPVEPPKVELVNAGPIRATLRISGRWSLPSACSVNRSERSARMSSTTISSEVSLFPGVQRIDIQTKVENKVKDHRLRVQFPVPYRAEQATAEATFGVQTRLATLPRPENLAEWIEEPVNTFPQKRFVAVSNGNIGLAVLNRGLPEYEILQQGPGIAEGQSAIALTLLRGVEWLSRGDLSVRRGHAGPMEHTPEGQCLGTHEFAYALLPHRETWASNQAAVLREAQIFNTPITTRALVTEEHEGQQPAQATLIQVEPAELVVSAIKRSNDGSGLIVRVYNPHDHDIEATLRPNMGIGADTHEGHDIHASLVNLQEEPVANIALKEHAIRITIQGNGIMTVLFTIS